MPTDVLAAAGVTLRPVTSEAGVELLVQVHENRVFGRDQSGLRQVDAHRAARGAGADGDGARHGGRRARVRRPGRTPPPAPSSPAYGAAGPSPAWRGQGIYRALISYRAGLAARRGYRYLNVDATGDSEPILRRLGFRCLARTTPYQWAPGAAS